MTKSMSPAQSEAFMKQLSKFVLVGNYKAGLPIAKKALKEFPQDLLCQYQYAKLLGDWADELPMNQRKKRKAEAASILRPLTRRLQGQSPERRFGICLNYYYQSSAFKEMYQFGKRFAAVEPSKGLYAQALGAVLYAEQIHAAHNQAFTKRTLKSWAGKSVAAWESYGLRKERYYFAHYSYAKALALQGDGKKAMASLKKAARLGKRPVTNWEFKDVLDLISALPS